MLDAYANASDGEYVEGVWVVNERTMLAAALRAAADQVVPTEIATASKWPERHDVRRQILSIAAEVDGTTRTSEND